MTILTIYYLLLLVADQQQIALYETESMAVDC